MPKPDPVHPFADRELLEHAKKILEAPSEAGAHPLEQQQYKFYTTLNVLMLALVKGLIAELPKESNNAR